MSFQELLLALPSFLLVLSVVVFVHEFGHFQAARWLKVAVDTFSIGFGKTLLSWRDKKGVDWKIGALPLGGYVKFTGDADAVSSHSAEPIAEDPQAKAAARARGLFHAQPIWVRAIVVAAGPLTNFIFAIFAFGVLSMINGVDRTDYETLPPYIAGVAENTAAHEAGLRAGETVLRVDGETIIGRENFRELIAGNPGQTFTLTLQADGETRDVAVTPRADNSGQRGLLGVSLGAAEADMVVVRPDPFTALWYGARSTWAIISMTVDYIGQIFSGRASAGDISGPLGIFVQSGKVTQSAVDAAPHDDTPMAARIAMNLLAWAAMLSVAVGFVNLLPIPILDGGHLVLYGVEAARGGKPLPPMAQEWAFRAGLAVIACLFLFATWNDLTRTFFGASG